VRAVLEPLATNVKTMFIADPSNSKSDGIKPINETYIPILSDPAEPNIPYVHKNEVKLRIIVIAYNRKDSLLRCLNSIIDLDTEGDKVALDIFLDRGRKDGKIHIRLPWMLPFHSNGQRDRSECTNRKHMLV
jgi:hypothetical protein